jgi:hypothetical protein
VGRDFAALAAAELVDGHGQAASRAPASKNDCSVR